MTKFPLRRWEEPSGTLGNLKTEGGLFSFHFPLLPTECRLGGVAITVNHIYDAHFLLRIAEEQIKQSWSIHGTLIFQQL